ncbi:MAG: hypothetical protein KC457_25220, partial [Myxococcales bacterium]|nr:hypothetical protein [Myxococcales bacterium]
MAFSTLRSPLTTKRTIAQDRLFCDPPVDPSRLDPQARRRLSTELYAAHCRIFSGVDEHSFHDYVIAPEDADTRIQLYRDQAGEIVGYFAI